MIKDSAEKRNSVKTGLHFVPLHRRWEGLFAAYQPEDMAIYRVTGAEKALLEQARSRETEALLQKWEKKPVNAARMVPAETEQTGFDTLILHISNACNLRCAYCFAGHGSYASAPGLMTPRTAVTAIERYLHRYGSIREVKLFGGEPLLNPDVMEAVGREIREKRKLNTDIKIITNGTIMPLRIREIIRDYGMKVVFSIDGDKAVHDRGRFYAGGAGTFDRICENFQKLRQTTGGTQPYSVDVTYSAIQEQAGVRINDLVWLITDRFGIKPSRVNVSTITVPQDSVYALHRAEPMLEAAQEALCRAAAGDNRTHMKLKAVIRTLKNRTEMPQAVCAACRTWAAVSYQGKVYPCLMFMDRQEDGMGDVRDDDFFMKPGYQAVTERFQSYRKREHEPCSSCYLNRACAMCMGINEFETGSLYTAAAHTCEEYQGIADVVMEGIAEEVW